MDFDCQLPFTVHIVHAPYTISTFNLNNSIRWYLLSNVQCSVTNGNDEERPKFVYAFIDRTLNVEHLQFVLLKYVAMVQLLF